MLGSWLGPVLVGAGILLATWLPLPWFLLGAAAQLAGIALRPWLVIPAVVLTLPYHLHPKLLVGFELSVSEITLILGTVGVVLRGVWDRRSRSSIGSPGSVQWPRPSAIDLGAALFLGAALISLLVTEYPKQSLRELRWLVVEPIAFFYLARATLTAGSMATATLWALALAGALAALVSMAALAADGALTDLRARATEPFLSPNHLGLFLGRSASAAMALLLFGEGAGARGRATRWGSGLVLVTIAAGVLRSISLGAWAGLAAVALTLTALRSRLLLLAAASALGIVALGAVFTLPPERISARLDPEVGTAQSRLYVWQAAARMIVDHPILGIGLDNFLYAYRTEYMPREAWREPNLSHPHNWVLHFWLQLGILGLAAACGLLLWAGIAAHRAFRHPLDPADRALAAAAAGMLVDFLIHGSLDNSYFLVDAAMLWWLALGLLATRSENAPNGPVLQSDGPKAPANPQPI